MNQEQAEEHKHTNTDIKFINVNDNLYFKPWECVSLIRRDNGATLDLIIKDRKELMCLLSVLGHALYGADVHKVFIKQMLRMQFKMKISYSSWLRKKQIGRNIIDSILVTLEERFSVAKRNLQCLIRHEDGVPLFNESSSNSIQAYLPEEEIKVIVARLLVHLDQDKTAKASLQNEIRKCISLTSDIEKRFAELVYEYWLADWRRKTLIARIAHKDKFEQFWKIICFMHSKIKEVPYSASFFMKTIDKEISKQVVKLTRMNHSCIKSPYYKEFFEGLDPASMKEQIN